MKPEPPGGAERRRGRVGPDTEPAGSEACRVPALDPSHPVPVLELERDQLDQPDQLLTPAQRMAQTAADPGLEVRLSAAWADVEHGMTMRQAATKHGLGEWQVRRLIRTWDSTDYEGTVRNLLKAQGLSAIQAWAQAMHQAAEKGRHEPARDLLTHAGMIEPVTGQEGTGKTNIAIVIGTPDQPVSLQSLQVIENKD